MLGACRVAKVSGASNSTRQGIGAGVRGWPAGGKPGETSMAFEQGCDRSGDQGVKAGIGVERDGDVPPRHARPRALCASGHAFDFRVHEAGFQFGEQRGRRAERLAGEKLARRPLAGHVGAIIA